MSGQPIEKSSYVDDLIGTGPRKWEYSGLLGSVNIPQTSAAQIIFDQKAFRNWPSDALSRLLSELTEKNDLVRAEVVNRELDRRRPQVQGLGLLGQKSIHPQTGKPMLKNPDGSVSTEESITVEVDGRYYNIPTIYNGVRLPPQAAELLFKAGQNKPLGEYQTLEEAVAAAKARSNSLGRGLLGR